ncbi:MAG: family 78 glycoside hydrolase catalytic domain [Bacillales bacterium]|nr:family 78 glycoside hydrolase catalytic domain [Bacillales bacterium]
MFKINEFKVNYKKEYCCSDCINPSFSFSIISDEKDSYLKKAILKMNGWEKHTNSQNGIVYEGEPLKPFTKYDVILEVEDSLGNKDSASLIYETGYLLSSFKGKWISDGDFVFNEKGVSPTPLLFKKHLVIKNKVKSVKVYSTALGIYDFLLNGKKVGDYYFAPGFTSYKHQLQYQVYDITSLIKEENDLFFEVAGGWAVGSFVFTRKNKDAADRQALLCDIHIEYENGEKEVIGSDESWDVSSKSPVLMADIYDGETYDANVSLNEITFHKVCLEKVRVSPKLLLDYGANVTSHEVFKPQSIKKLTDQYIIDFGQNFAGVVSLKIKNAKKGQIVTVKHAEILNKDGSLNTKFLRSAKATLTYICKEGEQVYSPTLTYMGFRYVSLSGIDIKDIDIEAIALYSDIEKIGSFECSNPLINRLQKNIEWSSKSNFVDIPTDCPQRDERMGWTGDIAVFASTACFNFDVTRFLDKWLLDLRSQQLKTGGIPNTIPVHKYGFPATMPKMAIDFWGDASILVPWALYEKTGDVSLLEKSYDSMKKYVNACKFWANLLSVGKNRYIWHTPSIFHFGDWVAPDVPKMSQWQARSKWTATASLKNTSSLLSKVAGILGKKDDEKFYLDLANNVSNAYETKLMDGNGKLKNEFQTGYVLPLHFNMLNKNNMANAITNLINLIEKNNYCIGTGFPGTPYILFALSDNGHSDVAYKMLENTNCPSWLYEVKAGATSIWERWDGLDENGICTIGEDGTGGMISYNHYASGAVGDFLYRRVAGIDYLEPGYRKMIIKPIIGGTLTYAKASTKTLYGTIISEWKINQNVFSLHVEIPYGCEAKVVLPNGEEYQITHGKKDFYCNL